MTTAIFVEIDGTVCRQSAEGHPLRTALRTVLGTVEDAWIEHYDERFTEHSAALVVDPRQRALADVVEQFDLDTASSTLAEELLAAEVAGCTVSDAARTSLRALTASDRLGVLTDESPAWAEHALDEHELDVFETVVTAADAGAHKPDTAIFEYARERLDCDEYVLVGPDYERDVEGARAAGFVPIHFEQEGPDFWETLNALV